MPTNVQAEEEAGVGALGKGVVTTADGLGRLAGARQSALVLVLLCDALLFAFIVNRYYPIDHWLFWRYLAAASLTVSWASSCLAGGDALLLGILGRALPFREQLALAFPAGVFVFQLAIFLAGLVHLLGAPLFVVLPVTMVAIGGPNLAKRTRSFVRHRAALVRRRTDPHAVGPAVLAAAGLVGVCLLYFQILSPEVLGFDARWYHMPLAEHYAADGVIRRMPEGWWLSAYPHLASHLFTWAFLAPGAITFDKVELSLHMELAAFVGMLAAIPVAVRKLVPRATGAGTWALYFLFPEVFLYDSNLNGGADHVAALFALPLGITALRAAKNLSPRECSLFAIMAAGVILAKYSAYCILFAPFLALTLRSAWLVTRGGDMRSRLSALRGPLLAVLLGLLLTTPFWLKNWIWYGDPFYPLLRDYFKPPMWFPEARYTWANLMGNLAPARPGWDGIRDALRATVLFPFEVHDWAVFHRDIPIFGPLFTLTIPCLPFLRAGRRTWIVYASALSAVFLWYLPCHYERYLQVVVPWMAAATAAVLILLYRWGVATRLALAPLLLLCVVWGGDVYFFPTDNMVNDSPVRVVSKFLASGFAGTKNRYVVNSPLGEVGSALPKGSRLLVHQIPSHLGIGVPSVQDLWQAGFSYGRLVTPAAIYAKLSGMGVTHLLWTKEFSEGRDSVGSDLAFYSFVTRHGDRPKNFGGYTLARMPSNAPPGPFDDRVAFFACHGPYRKGLYHLGDMNEPPDHAPFESLSGKPKQTLGETDFAVVDPDCAGAPSKADLAPFRFLFRRDVLHFYARRH